ncbi:hypothetical protein COF78_10775 [Bacillus pseudomycoides]|nr:hypothetical protein COF78_10775 [Bacillus pseudomycoides]
MQPLSRYSRAVSPPPQSSAKAKKVGGVGLPVKARLVRANNQWGMEKPLIKVSLYWMRAI